MHHAELTEAVRGFVAEAFADLRLSGEGPPRESLMIRGGMYCGRRFDAEHGHALWFFEEDQIKVFGADGGVLRVMERVSAPQMGAAGGRRSKEQGQPRARQNPHPNPSPRGRGDGT